MMGYYLIIGSNIKVFSGMDTIELKHLGKCKTLFSALFRRRLCSLGVHRDTRALGHGRTVSHVYQGISTNRNHFKPLRGKKREERFSLTLQTKSSLTAQLYIQK